MKFGYFVALILAGLTLGAGLLAYWDLQDGTFFDRSIYLPIVFGVMALAFALFPGERTAAEVAENDAFDRVDTWASNVPALHKKVWLGSLVLAFTLGTVAVDYLKGEDVLSFGELAKLVIFMLVLFFVFRWYARRKGY